MLPRRLAILPSVLALLALPVCGQSPAADTASTPAGNAPPTATTSSAAGAAESGPGRAGRNPPAYPIPYAPATIDQIQAVLDRVLTYLETASPARVVDQATGQTVTDLSQLPERPVLARGDFLAISYEWGVTYAGMLLAADATKDARYSQFVGQRFDLIRTLADHYRAHPPKDFGFRFQFRSVLAPATLDDCGAMAAAMLKAQQANVGGDLKPIINTYLTHITQKQQRFEDGTLARNRPLPNTLWLDDMYMSIPALSQMGKFTGEARYLDDAVRQYVQFSQRMFVKEKGLFMHGWVQGMEPHPTFHWARANGWAAMAAVELLSALPENHPGRADVLATFRAHMRGLALTQGINGLWHQLLDRSETYEETSASAMFVFALARGINRGWLDPLAYGPVASIGWNAVTKKVNDKGQVEATCVGTGMAWEPVFYAYRPTSVYAAHGYGPVLLAGAEMIALRRGSGEKAVLHDGGVHYGEAVGPVPGGTGGANRKQ